MREKFSTTSIKIGVINTKQTNVSRETGKLKLSNFTSAEYQFMQNVSEHFDMPIIYDKTLIDEMTFNQLDCKSSRSILDWLGSDTAFDKKWVGFSMPFDVRDHTWTEEAFTILFSTTWN